MERIKKKQKKLQDNLTFLNSGLSVITKTPTDKDLSKGCQSCKDGTWWCLYVGQRCNLDCSYCPQGSSKFKETKVDDDRAMQRLWIDDIKTALQMVKPGTIKGISYSGGEPFMYLPKIIDMASFITKLFPNIYQWVYTNGLLVTGNKLQILKDIGLNEIRFHLGATNFNQQVLDKVKLAVNIFDIVTVETPGTPALKNWCINEGGLHFLQDIGVHQMNIAELYLIKGVNQIGYENDELYQYTSLARGSHVSPTSSRMITYDIIEYCIENKIDILINDCSHQSRDAQIITRELNRNRLKEMY